MPNPEILKYSPSYVEGMWRKYTEKKLTTRKQPKTPPSKKKKKHKNKPTKTKIPTTQQNKSYLNYITLEVKSTEYQNEELFIPTLTTVVGRFSSKHVLCC